MEEQIKEITVCCQCYNYEHCKIKNTIQYCFKYVEMKTILKQERLSNYVREKV